MKWYVGVYELNRRYGGHEEGGWYFNTGTLVDYKEALNKEHAELLANELSEGQYSNEGLKHDIYSVAYQGEQYEVRVEENVPCSWSDWSPWE